MLPGCQVAYPWLEKRGNQVTTPLTRILLPPRKKNTDYTRLCKSCNTSRKGKYKAHNSSASWLIWELSCFLSGGVGIESRGWQYCQYCARRRLRLFNCTPLGEGRGRKQREMCTRIFGLIIHGGSSWSRGCSIHWPVHAKRTLCIDKLIAWLACLLRSRSVIIPG